MTQYLSPDDEISALRQRVAQLELEIAVARAETKEDLDFANTGEASPPDITSWPLSLPEYRRYGRQMILDGFGLPCASIQFPGNILYSSTITIHKLSSN